MMRMTHFPGKYENLEKKLKSCEIVEASRWQLLLSGEGAHDRIELDVSGSEKTDVNRPGQFLYAFEANPVVP